MSAQLKAGEHPDADQLSCFMERTLPPHEREQTLAHLAICPQCRRLISLALPEIEAPSVAAPVAERSGPSRWRTAAVPLAALCAVAVVGTVLLRQRASIQNNSAAPRHAAALYAPGSSDSGTAHASTAEASAGVAAAPARAAMSTTGDAGSLASSDPSIESSLPSKLGVLCQVTRARREIAIDVQHALFVSGDRGHHWQSVESPWRGRAVRVGLARPETAGTGTALAVNVPSMRETRFAEVSLTGVAKDGSGTAIQGASVIVRDSMTNGERSAITDDAGRYRIEGLAPDLYSISVQAPGFNRQKIEGVDLSLHQNAVADLTLSPGSAAETVLASGLQAGSGDASTRASQGELQPAVKAALPFQITTDLGEVWLSADGLVWVRQPVTP